MVWNRPRLCPRTPRIVVSPLASGADDILKQRVMRAYRLGVETSDGYVRGKGRFVVEGSDFLSISWLAQQNLGRPTVTKWLVQYALYFLAILFGVFGGLLC